MIAINRGDFVKIGSTFAGSLVIGAGVAGCSNQSSTSADSGATPAATEAPGFQPNAWLIVHPDEKVTVFVAKSEMGQGVATGLPTIVADELDIPFSNVIVEFAPAAAAYMDQGFKMQITGGSLSILGSWMILRNAGASAREMLVAAAAKNWNVDPKTLATKDGSVIDASNNRTATYGSLVADAASIPAPKHPTLKKPSQFTLIGKQNARYDTPAKVTGKAGYGIDVRVPGMKFASVLRPPVFGSKIVSFDATDAKKVSGVTDVVQIPSGIAVVATNSWAAFQGKQALKVTYDQGPLAHTSSGDLFARYESLAKSKAGAALALKVGNSAGVSGKTLEATYLGPISSHAAMEPMNATASVTADGVEIWAPTQVQTMAQMSAAKIAGVPPDRVAIHTTYLGGGFGRRLYTDFTDDAVHVSKAIKAPVQVIWQREDDMQHDWYKPMSVNAVRGVLDANGDLVAMDHTVVMDSIAKPLLPSMVKNGVDPICLDCIINSSYAVPNLTVHYIDPNSGIPPGSLRAPGANSNNFAVESFVDELAHAAGKDPIAFRLAMLHKSPRAAAVLKTVAKDAAWGSPAPGTKQGVAFGAWNGTSAAAIAEVSIVDKMPVVHRVFVVADCGTSVNPTIVEQQLEGATNYGLTMALSGKITIKNGAVEQHNFDDFTVVRLKQAPEIHARAMPSDAAPSGIGEIATILIAPAIANAIFAIDGRRVRTLPFSDGLA